MVKISSADVGSLARALERRAGGEAFFGSVGNFINLREVDYFPKRYFIKTQGATDRTKKGPPLVLLTQ